VPLVEQILCRLLIQVSFKKIYNVTMQILQLIGNKIIDIYQCVANLFDNIPRAYA